MVPEGEELGGKDNGGALKNNNIILIRFVHLRPLTEIVVVMVEIDESAEDVLFTPPEEGGGGRGGSEEGNTCNLVTLTGGAGRVA